MRELSNSFPRIAKRLQARINWIVGTDEVLQKPSGFIQAIDRLVRFMIETM